MNPNFQMLRAAAKGILTDRMRLPAERWTTQGFGFLRYRLNDNTRLHVWDSRLRVPGVSDIHDHAQWAFTSRVISGQIINIRYGEFHDLKPTTHQRGEIICGLGGGMSFKDSKEVRLWPAAPEMYLAGAAYRQEPQEIHRTFAADGTVTLIAQERTALDTARVFWPKGTAWVDAEPRLATPDEINFVGAHALSVFEGE